MQIENQKTSQSVELSILVCTMPSRQTMFNTLLAELNKQISLGFSKDVEILFDDDMSISTGEKRNKLLDRATGLFSVFVDDDDWIAEDYVQKIVECIKANRTIDCIGIKGKISFNGSNEKDWEISKDFGSWYEANGKYFRTPNHISPIKTEICLMVKFPHITIGEDSDFSHRVLPYLINESKIEGDLYFYRCSSPTSQQPIEFPFRPSWR